jgi:FMN phosphatase YigB (HAD superfamily)
VREGVRLPPAGAFRGLILDADLVLSSVAAWCRGLALLIWHVGHQFDPSSSDRLWRNRHLTAAYCGRREMGDVLDDYLSSLGLARGQRDEVLAAGLSQWREAEAQLHFLPGAREALRRIARTGCRLALVADATTTGVELKARLADFGLGDALVTIVTSVDVDQVLPDAACYQIASARLGLHSSETLFATDETAILAGASAAGLVGVGFGDCVESADGWRVNRLEQLAVSFQPTRPLARAG